MEKILLGLQSAGPRRQMQDWLAADYEVKILDSAEAPAPAFDLAIVDPLFWAGLKTGLEAAKSAAAPAFLPVLLVVTSLEDPVWTSDTGRTVDEVICSPLDRRELTLRVGNLLRARRWSGQTAIIASRQAEEALKEANERLTALIETSPLAIIALDADDRVTTWNHAAERIFGWTKEEILEKPLPLVPPEEQERFRTRRARDMQGEGYVGLEVGALKRDGSWIDIKLSAAPLYDASGQITGSISIAEDISTRKQTEQELARLASFPHLNPNPVLEVDLSGRITFYNQATLTALDLLGLSEVADFLPEDLPKIISAVREQRIKSFYREKKSGKAVFGQRIHWVEPFEVLRVYAFNITEMKEAEEALRRSKEEWERTFDAVPDLITILDREHRIQRVNRAMADLLGITPDQATGLKCYQAVHNLAEPPAFCPHCLLLADGREHTVEVQERGRDFLVTASPLIDAQGQPSGSVHVARDITERKKAEQAIRRQAELLDLAQDAIIVRDLQDRITFWNRGAEECYGWSREEALGKISHELLQTEFPRPVEDIEKELLAAGLWEGELVHTARDGRRLTMASSWTLRREEPGQSTRILAINHDITQRKQAEAALKQAHAELELRVAERTADLKATIEQLEREVDERQQAEKQAQSLGRLYRLLSQVDEAIVRAPDRDSLLQQVCRIAVEEGLFRLAWVGLKDPDGRAIKAVAQYGFDEGYLEALEIPLADVPESRGPTGVAVREERFDVCNDFTSNSRMAPWRDRALARGYRSSGAFPLRVAGTVVGALTLYAEKPGFFNEEEIALLESLSGDLSFAMESFDREARRRQAEEETRAVSAYARGLIEASLDPLVTISPAGKITDVNKATEEATGVDRARLIGSDFSDYFTEPDKARASYQQVFEQQVVRDYPLTLRHASGRTMNVLYHATVYRNAAGEVQGVFAAARDITARKRAEEELARHAALVQDLYNNAPCGYHSLGPDGTFVQINDTELAWLGYAREEVVGRLKFADILTPRSLKAFQENFAGFKERGWVRDLEFELVRRDGTVMPILLNATVVRDEAGNYRMSRSTVFDLTERRRVEEALRESEERFAMFMRHLPGAAFMRDTRERYVFANETWERMFGKKQPEWLGKTLEEVWPPEYATHFRETDQAVLQSRQAVQGIETFPTSQGDRHFLATRFPILDQAGNPVLLGGIGIDITDRQQAEAALREQTRVLDAFFAHSLTPLVILDRDFNFIRVNEAYARACQRTPEEFAGRNHFKLYPHEENQAIFTEVVRTKTPYQAVAKAFEFPDHPEWGVTYWDWTLVPILDEAGNVEFLVFSLKDVTPRQRAKDALKESEQKLRFLTSQILSIQEEERRRLSRELHDGLGQALLVFKLQMRAIERGLPETYKGLKEDCRHALRYVDEIIEDIRRISRDLSPSVLEDIGLAAAIKNLCEEFRRLHDLEISLDMDELKGELSKEAQINIYRIIQESFTNISKYAFASHIELAIKKEEEGLTFCIRDDGIGFPVEDTLTRGGQVKGMGLAAMAERVRMLAGALRITSRKGAGTTITFTIPREE